MYSQNSCSTYLLCVVVLWVFSYFLHRLLLYFFFFFFQAEDGIRDLTVTGVQTCALPILRFSVRSPDSPSLICSGISRGTGGSQRCKGRLYKGASSVSASLGISATKSPCSITRILPSLVTRPTSTASSPHFSKTRNTSSSRPFWATSSMRSCDSLSMIS